MNHSFPLTLAACIDDLVDPPSPEAASHRQQLCEALLELFPEGHGAILEARGEVPRAELEAFCKRVGLREFAPKHAGGTADWAGAMRKAYYFAAHETDVLLCLGGALLGGFPIWCAGSEMQQKEFFDALAQGHLAAFGISEWARGLDVLQNETVAEPVDRQGQPCALSEATHFRLRGEKAPVNNATAARFVTVVARTKPGQESDTQTLFLLRRGLRGLDAGKRYPTIGYRCMDLSTVVLNGAIVPREDILGKEGEGFAQTRRALEISRSGVATMAAGVHLRLLALCVAHAQERVLYGAPISALGAIRGLLAGIFARAVEAAALVRFSAHLVAHAAVSARFVTSVAKYQVPHTLEQCVYRGETLLGARSQLEELPFARLKRASSLFAIFDGSSFLQKEELWRCLLTWSEPRSGSVEAYRELRCRPGAFSPWAKDDALVEGLTPLAVLGELSALFPGDGLDVLEEAAAQLKLVAPTLRRATQSQRFFASELASDLYAITALGLSAALAETDSAGLLRVALRVRCSELLRELSARAALLGMSLTRLTPALEPVCARWWDDEEQAAAAALSLYGLHVI